MALYTIICNSSVLYLEKEGRKGRHERRKEGRKMKEGRTMREGRTMKERRRRC